MCRECKYSNGDGSREHPYEIANEEEFIHFSQQCMREPAYMYYVLKKDLDMSAYLWKPIGMLESQVGYRRWRRGFCGSLDGEMHCIKGLKLEIEEEDVELHCLGLFAMIGAYESWGVKSSEVKNLQVHYDNQSCLLQGDDTYFGGIAGLVYNSSVKHCIVTANVLFLGEKKGLYAGGVAGILRGVQSQKEDTLSSIKDCSYQGTMIATVRGKITPKVYMGGIVGSMQGKQCEINHCISHAFLHGSFTGELVGSNMGGTVTP